MLNVIELPVSFVAVWFPLVVSMPVLGKDPGAGVGLESMLGLMAGLLDEWFLRIKKSRQRILRRLPVPRNKYKSTATEMEIPSNAQMA